MNEPSEPRYRAEIVVESANGQPLDRMRAASLRDALERWRGVEPGRGYEIINLSRLHATLRVELRGGTPQRGDAELATELAREGFRIAPRSGAARGTNAPEVHEQRVMLARCGRDAGLLSARAAVHSALKAWSEAAPDRGFEIGTAAGERWPVVLRCRPADEATSTQDLDTVLGRYHLTRGAAPSFDRPFASRPASTPERGKSRRS